MLPYQTLQDAEVSLGRNLTFAEALWFRYSSQKSDYFLYCHNTIFLFIFYTLLPLPYVVMELMRSDKIDRFKIQPKMKNSLSDMLDCYKKVVITFVLAVGPLQIFSYPVIQMIGIRTSLPLPSCSEVLCQLLVYFLVEDYANYWLHRMLHNEWGYNRIHRVHHEYTAPIGFAAPYAHWAEIIILGLASFLGPLIVPCHMVTFWLWMIVRQMEAVETHSGYDFPWSPSKYIPFYGGADFHDYHHFVGGKSQSNFASVFTYCDYIYGTNKGYLYKKEYEKARKELKEMLYKRKGIMHMFIHIYKVQTNTMSESKDVKFDLKIVINKQKNKVVFAEADSSFIDVLISFLTMPLGTVVRVLKNHYGGDETPAIGSLTSLYLGLANLDSANFWTEGCKAALLSPTSPFEAKCRKLKLDISDTQPPEYLSCQNTRCGLRNFEPFSAMYCQSMYYDTAKCHCGQLMTREAGQKKYCQADNDAGAVFTINTTTSSFIISDDLQIFPDITGFVQILRNLGISDTDGTEPRNVTFGFNEIMALLKTSLLSKTPLTDFILDKRQIYSGRTTYEAGVSLHQIKKEATSNSRKMNLKVILHKSTNKLLFAQADDDFVDFLCSLLAVPLGGVEHLCGGSTCLNSIGNLYRSIANIDDKYLATPDMKTGLVKPKLRHGYIPENPILPLTEESHSPTIRISKRVTIPFSSQRFPNGQGKYVRGPRMYKLTDDLTVTPFCMAATLSVLDGLNIPVSDLQDLQLEIGSEEALSILKASLTSSSALTDGLLINTMLRKQPKQEH